LDAVSQKPDVSLAEVTIRKAHLKADWVIISIHWGGEYEGGPAPQEIELASHLVQAGADIIAGHHPHVLQVVRKIQTGEKTSLIAYSLGNALFDQPSPPGAMQGTVLVVKLGQQGVESIEPLPFMIDQSLKNVRLAAPEESAGILHKLDLQLNADCGCN
jgi:poly-gamma-glutamate synthesis protein (capsule biosynthesis protein)